MKMQKVDINLIDPNPHRRFDINPIDDLQVSQLLRSYRQSGDFGVLPGRQVGDRFEIAAGHHRLSAMAKAGFSHIDMKIADYSKLDMLMMMANENATQHGGKPSSQADTVAATIVQLAEWFTTASTAAEFNGMAEPLFSNVKTGAEISAPVFFGGGDSGENGGFTEAKQEMLNGSISGRSVHRLLGKTLKKDAIWTSIRGLEMSGKLGDLIEDGRNTATEALLLAEAEKAANLAALEAEAKRADELAAKTAERTRKVAERQAEESRKARDRAKKAQDRQAKQAAEQAELRAEIARAKANLAEDARKAAVQAAIKRSEAEAVRRVEAEKLAAKRAHEQAQVDAALEIQRKNPLIDPDVFALLKNNYQQETFLRAVGRNPKVLGQDHFGQVEFLKELGEKCRKAAPRKAQADANRDNVSFITISQLDQELAAVDKKLNAIKREQIKQQKAAADASSLERRVISRMIEMQGAMQRIAIAADQLHSILGEDGASELVLSHPYSQNLPKNIGELEYILPKLKEFYRVSSQSLAPKSTLAIDGESNIIDIN